MHDKGQRSLQPHIPIDPYTNNSHNRDSKNTFHNNRNGTPSKPPRRLEPKIMNSSTIKPLSSISDKSSTSPPLEEVIEEPFIKKYYYKLGPRDPPLPSSSSASASARTEYGKKAPIKLFSTDNSLCRGFIFLWHPTPIYLIHILIIKLL